MRNLNWIKEFLLTFFIATHLQATERNNKDTPWEKEMSSPIGQLMTQLKEQYSHANIPTLYNEVLVFAQEKSVDQKIKVLLDYLKDDYSLYFSILEAIDIFNRIEIFINTLSLENKDHLKRQARSYGETLYYTIKS